MQVHFGSDLLRVEWSKSVACIGTFDGVHLGHRKIIETAVANARSRGLPTVVITFDRHPAAVLAPDRCPLPVASIRSNLAQFTLLGVELTLVLPFDRGLADTTAESFYEAVIRNAVRAESMVVGHDFAFGHDRVGTTSWLAERIDTEVVPPFEMNGTRVSSSAVRAAVSEGRMSDAAAWLGRPYAIEGVVVHGAQLGREIGYPTANLARTFRQITPSDGVYTGTAHLGPDRYRAAISIGVRPTIGDTDATIEAYLLDYKGSSLYGRSIKLDIEKRLRDQERFDSLESLKEQIAADVAAARG